MNIVKYVSYKSITIWGGWLTWMARFRLNGHILSRWICLYLKSSGIRSGLLQHGTRFGKWIDTYISRREKKIRVDHSFRIMPDTYANVLAQSEARKHNQIQSASIFNSATTFIHWNVKVLISWDVCHTIYNCVYYDRQK